MILLLPLIAAGTYGLMRFLLAFVPIAEIDQVAISALAAGSVVAGLVGWTISKSK